jgi:putative transposase
MPQSLARILVHLVFSTKGRTPFLKDETVRKDLDAYIAGILRQCESPVAVVKSTKDHVHIFCSLSKNLPASKLVEEVKTGSSKWLKTRAPAFAEFHWQAGYGIFSVSPSNEEAVRSYVLAQEDHHRTLTFQDEFRRILEKHGVQFDERFVWD